MPTNVLCKLDYLSGALPTLDQLSTCTIVMNRRIVGWAVPTNVLCKLDYLSDPLPTLHQLSTCTIVINPRVGSAYQRALQP
ncbi:MAG: hypothetical protein F6K56_34460 [Moorea sp. SIO3G5]|nr:hypothetical protein [Moorena sp. SIO3G5]